MKWTSFLIIILSILLIISTVYILQLKLKQKNAERLETDTKMITSGIYDQLKKIKQDNNYLRKVIYADENIFDFIRCINIPQTPVCKSVPNADQIGVLSGDEKNKSNICRSRFINCDKYKLMLENDPIARERVLVATNRWHEADKPRNPSELTYPIKSWWLF